jgi:Lrp/AsnC family transcriptional regulator, leucine-responsive regulatory protein
VQGDAEYYQGDACDVLDGRKLRQAFEMPEAAMDDADRRIVAEMQAAPRLRVAELARRIGLSGPAVADRLRRLEETGTLSYRAEVNPRALGYTICAIVRISPAGVGLRLIPGIAREVPNVTECSDHRGGLLLHEGMAALHRRP